MRGGKRKDYLEYCASAFGNVVKDYKWDYAVDVAKVK